MLEKQFVLFKINNEVYGIDVMEIREIAPYQKIDQIPNAPLHIVGVTNFRGQITPVINIKELFNFNNKITKDERLIVVSRDKKQIGFLVDKACGILKLKEEEIEKSSQIIVELNEDFISGIGKKDDKLIFIINLSRIIELKSVQNVDQIDLQISEKI
ncbi:MAG: chemotaxis protein CheW [Maledivibacter sp.]|jgi:purine-binding chemotaxis protein CheW|nr:chemotaxis protein CheW [Maledivibacter sp.]